MTNDEILARIANDVADSGIGMFGVRNITIWITKDLFNRLCSEQIAIHNDSAMITLFGCVTRVVLFPGDGLRWIVGYEGEVKEDE